MLFETHAHYDNGRFDTDREELLSALPGAGIGWVVNPGCDLPTSRTAVALAGKFPHVYAAVGFHPSDCAGCEGDWLEEIRALAQSSHKVVAIGEIGLDYYWKDNPPRERQQAVFRAQLALAEELDLPVIVHDREAHQDSMAIVREFPRVRGVFHCYSGSLEDAKTLIRLGWNLSFTGSVTYKNAKKAPEVLAWIPEDRFMIETDSPYMLPYPRVKGEKRNDSSKLPRIAAKIAAIRGLTEAEVERISTENGIRFFGLEPPAPGPQ